MGTVESVSHRLNTYGVGIGPGAEIIVEVESMGGPRISDLLLVLTVEQTRTLSRSLLQSITDTEVKPEPEAPPVVKYPIPTADLAQHLYGYPYGEE